MTLSPPDARAHPPRQLFAAAVVLSAIALAALYLRLTCQWTDADFRSFADGSMHYPQALSPFRTRVLIAWLARPWLALPFVKPRALFACLAALEVGAILVIFRRVLAWHVRKSAADVSAFVILLPLAANYLLLNRLYLPFDLPSVLLFAIAYDACQREDWSRYYVVLAMAALNREASGLLITLFLCTQLGRRPLRSVVSHLGLQSALWLAIVAGLHRTLGGDAPWTWPHLAEVNRRTLLEMASPGGPRFAHDWLKLFGAFGGLWWMVPFTWGRQPKFVQRTAWVLLPTLLATAWRGILGEVRLYAELIPVVATPAALALARLIPAAPAADEVAGKTARGRSR